MILHLERIDFHLSGAVGGNLYVTIGEIAFPEAGWYDLVSADFEEWLPRLLSFAQHHTDSCVLQFQDGPCVINFSRTGNLVSVACLWDRKVCVPETEIHFTDFLKSVAVCIGMYRRVCYEKGYPLMFTQELTMLKNQIKKESFVYT